MYANVYGMICYSDGGFFMKKPYISSSNYILKMSNYKKSIVSEELQKYFEKYNFKNI